MVAHSARLETEFLGSSPVSRPLAQHFILLALILLGFWLRVHNLDAFSFWTDEGLTPARSGYPIAQILRNEIVIQGYVSTDTHPPLYYLIIHVTRQLFGLSDFAFRYPSVLFGVLLIPLLYQLGRRLVPSPLGRELGSGPLLLGLLVALLTTVNPLQVTYSQEARMYTLLVLLATGMSTVLWRTLRATADGRPLTAVGGGSRGQVPGAREEASSPGTWPLEPGTFSAFPPNRYWSTCVIKASSRANAARLLRKSPGGNRPISRRSRPLLPPSSATVTMAVMLLVKGVRPRNRPGSPVPPPMATICGPRSRRRKS